MVHFRIPNMNCGGCLRSVTATLHGITPAAEVKSDLQRREVAISTELETPGLALAWQDALKKAGFAAQRLEA